MLPQRTQTVSIKAISTPSQAHMIGAAGAGMKALAEILLDARWTLTGSDSHGDTETLERLKKQGMNIAGSHSESAIPGATQIVIHSAAISENNPERQQATDWGLPQRSYHEAVAQLIADRCGIAVAGTHGKSSTTCLLVSLFEAAGLSPTFLCGAERLTDGRNGKLGNGEYVIFEACEYRNHFLAYRPQISCLLGIEPDHFDCFPNFEDAVQSYRAFVQLIPENGVLVFNADCEIARAVSHETRAKTVSFSQRDQSADWSIESHGSDVTVCLNNRHKPQRETFSYPIPGAHQLANLVAALATAAAAGLSISTPAVQQAIANPPRLKRRFEILESSEQLTVIDDYAHHPTEIIATLNTTREYLPNRRIVCCFQPHQLSRTQALRAAFVDALALADQVYMLPVFGAREGHSEQLTLESKQIVTMLKSRNVEAAFIPSLDRVWSTVETDTRYGDIFLTLGAGDLTRIHNERTRRIQRNHED